MNLTVHIDQKAKKSKYKSILRTSINTAAVLKAKKSYYIQRTPGQFLDQLLVVRTSDYISITVLISEIN